VKTILCVVACVAGLERGLAQQNDLDWLVGTWKLEGKNVYEIWSRSKAGSTLTGHSFHLQANDTVSDERITIRSYNGVYHYIPDVSGDQPAVDFTITHVDNSSFIAENPQHDFPKVIRYKYIQDETGQRLHATIEGDGKTIPYRFKKLK
jgi:hypothetical protein